MAGAVEYAAHAPVLGQSGEQAGTVRLLEAFIIQHEENVRVALLVLLLAMTLSAPACVSHAIFLRTALLVGVLLTFWTHFAADWLQLRRSGQFDIGAGVGVIGDFCWLVLLVYATGGLASPFSALLLCPILFAAAFFSHMRFAVSIVTGLVVAAVVAFGIRGGTSTLAQPWQITGMLMAIIALGWAAYGVCLGADSERRTKDLVIGHLSEAVLLVDSSGSIVMANPQIEQLTGVPLSRIVGAALDDIVQDPERQALASIVAGVGTDASGTGAQVREVTIERREPVEVRRSIIPCPGPAGGRVGWIVVCQDLSEPASLARMRQNGIMMLSHEMRSPLTTLRIGATLLSRLAERLNDDSSSHFAQVLESETERLLTMAAQVLDAVSLDQETCSLHKRPTDIRVVLTKVAKAVEVRASERSVSLQTELPGILPPISADPDRLEDVLHELCDNALKYTPPGGEIRLAAAREDSSICISVSDTGRGIPAEAREMIFEKFAKVQDDCDGDSSERGIGLGLYTVKRVVELHGGHVSVQSEPGRGSVFTVVLPAVPGTGERCPSQYRATPVSAGP